MRLARLSLVAALVAMFGALPAGTAGGASSSIRPSLLVGVTAQGAVEVLDSSSGAVTSVLVPGGAIGDEVSTDGRWIYYEVANGCLGQIDKVPVAGGTPTVVTNGSLPDVSPNGTKLAFARQPDLSQTACIGNGNLALQYSLVVRTLSTGAEQTFNPDPRQSATGLPAPISHLSWDAKGKRLAVSISSSQDNEGWALVTINPSTASSYDPRSGTVRMRGANASQSYYREGVYGSRGNLFVSRQCCGGVPVNTTSVRLQVIRPNSGATVQQVAIGYTDRDHTSLDVDSSGHWLLYLSGTDLYISQNAKTPSLFTTGLIAAAW